MGLFDFLFGGSGGNSSRDTSSINNNIELSNIVEQNLSANASTSSNNFQFNSVDVEIGVPSICCANLPKDAQANCIALLAANKPTLTCDLRITQSGRLNIKFSAQATIQSNSQLINQLSSQIQDRLNTLLKQESNASVFNIFGVKNNADVSNLVTNSIKNDLSVKLTTEVQNQMRNASGQNNTANLNLCFGSIGNKLCDFNQNSSFDLYLTNMIGLISGIITQNTEFIKLDNATKSSTTQKSRSILSALLDGLGQGEKTIAICIAALVVLGIVVALVFGLRSLKGKRSHHDGIDYAQGYDHVNYGEPRSLLYNSAGLDPYHLPMDFL